MANVRLQTVWEKRCEIMRKKLTTLQFLQIDLEEAYCSFGCCRMVEEICEQLGPFEAFPSTLELIGIEDGNEATRVADIISTLNAVEPSKVVCKDARGTRFILSGHPVYPSVVMGNS